MLWFDDEATRRGGAGAAHAADRIGLLHRVAAALEEQELDVRWARVSTLGARCVDAFCLETAEHAGPRHGPPPPVEEVVLAAAATGPSTAAPPAG